MSRSITTTRYYLILPRFCVHSLSWLPQLLLRTPAWVWSKTIRKLQLLLLFSQHPVFPLLLLPDMETEKSRTARGKGGESKETKQGNSGKKGKCPYCTQWHYTKEGDFSDCCTLKGKKHPSSSSNNSGSNKCSKYQESSYGLKELSTLMEGA